MGKAPVPHRLIERIGAETREWIVGPNECPRLSALGIPLVGWSETSAAFTFVRPNPTFGQVLATVSGTGAVWADDRWQRIDAGQVYLSPPGALSAYHAIPDTPWLTVWAHCEATSAVFPQPISQLLTVDVKPLFTSVQGLYAELNDVAEADVVGHWAALVLTAFRRLTGVPRGDHRLRQLWTQVQADLAFPWTRDILGERIGLSGEQLRRLCHDAVGCGPMAYVARLRMQYAASLLGSGRYSVSEVATRVGYDNPFAFSTAFKRELGQPPSAYRNKA